MHAAEMLVAVMIPLGFFLMVFGIVYMYKRENLAMIEKGMDPGFRRKRSNRAINTLKGGLIFVGVGIGLLLAYYLDTNVISHEGDNNNPAVYFGLIGLCGGLGLVISYIFEKREPREKE